MHFNGRYHGFLEQMKQLSSYAGTTTQIGPWSPLLWKITKSSFRPDA